MARREPELTPQAILNAYASGIFPMAETRTDSELFWVDPRMRGIFPLDGFHVSRSLRQRILSRRYSITFDQDFAGVVQACANRQETWISARIEALYGNLFALGHAHSVEVWENKKLVGGIYGVTLGAAFFGESMFSTARDASKVGLAFLIKHLESCGFVLFDTQFLTDHLASLGAIEIPRATYHELLENAVSGTADFSAPAKVIKPQDAAQRSSQTS